MNMIYLSIYFIYFEGFFKFYFLLAMFGKFFLES